MFHLAKRCERIDASGIRRVFDLAKALKNPINLSIGQPDFDVPAPVKAAAIAAIESGQNTYTPTQGIAELRAQLRHSEQQRSGRNWAEDELIITSGVSGGLFLALLALVEEGDEVIIPDPYFVMYKHLVRLFGGTPVYLDTYNADFGIDPQALEQAISPRSKLLLLNSPANPTGRVLSAEELQAVAAVCKRHHLAVLSDEIYSAFAYEPAPSMSAFYEQTLVLGGYSKSHGMTGWRLGWAAGPAKLIQAMAKIQQYSFVCAPSVTQFASLACPEIDLRQPIAAYREKRDLMVRLLSDTFALAPPQGAFYLWAKPPSPWTGDAFAEAAIKAGVLIIPGSVFSERGSHFRMCYTVPNEILEAGCRKLVELAKAGPS
ncbi:MAG: aminotransferase class I/II-fold pyridoxal phosphate-dependent enzyme [Planctomycetota bacterium]|nr:MAG: aminotransferase class I/II-fold pyridoxal phosphate-dependent enzyme [Planctomycetota bacterium]